MSTGQAAGGDLKWHQAPNPDKMQYKAVHSALQRDWYCTQTDVVPSWSLLLPVIQCFTQIIEGAWEVSHSLIKLGQGHKVMFRHQSIVLRFGGGLWLDSSLSLTLMLPWLQRELTPPTSCKRRALCWEFALSGQGLEAGRKVSKQRDADRASEHKCQMHHLANGSYRWCAVLHWHISLSKEWYPPHQGKDKWCHSRESRCTHGDSKTESQ